MNWFRRYIEKRRKRRTELVKAAMSAANKTAEELSAQLHDAHELLAKEKRRNAYKCESLQREHAKELKALKKEHDEKCARCRQRMQKRETVLDKFDLQIAELQAQWDSAWLKLYRHSTFLSESYDAILRNTSSIVAAREELEKIRAHNQTLVRKSQTTRKKIQYHKRNQL